MGKRLDETSSTFAEIQCANLKIQDNNYDTRTIRYHPIIK